jgi:hypothetical protein
MDIRNVGFDHRLCFTNLLLIKPDRTGQVNVGCQPKFRLSIWVRDMHMNAWLFARKEKETELTFPENCWCHAERIPQHPQQAKYGVIQKIHTAQT